MSDRFAGVWLLDQGEGVLLLTTDGWYSVQVAGGESSAGHYGIEGDRFLFDPVVASIPGAAGKVDAWHWALDGDVLVLDGVATTQRWHREGAEVVTGLGAE